MSWQTDPRYAKLMDKALIESLLKTIFSEVYCQEEISKMENGLKKSLSKYDKKTNVVELLHGNDETKAEPYLQECLEFVCQKNYNTTKKHTPKTFLRLAKFFTKIGDYRIASELVWGCASLDIRNFCQEHDLKVDLHSHKSKGRFARALSEDIGRIFPTFELCHCSFYTNENNFNDMTNALKEAIEFLKKLRELHMPTEKKKKLERTDFF